MPLISTAGRAQFARLAHVTKRQPQIKRLSRATAIATANKTETAPFCGNALKKMIQAFDK